MTKYIFILSLILIIGCTRNGATQNKNEKQTEELKADTKVLKSLHDSLNTTGDYQYYNKYILKIDEMIKKYPEQKQLTKVRDQMKKIFEE